MELSEFLLASTIFLNIWIVDLVGIPCLPRIQYYFSFTPIFFLTLHSIFPYGVLLTLCCLLPNSRNSRILWRYLFLGSSFLERSPGILSAPRHIVVLLHHLALTCP